MRRKRFVRLSKIFISLKQELFELFVGEKVLGFVLIQEKLQFQKDIHVSPEEGFDTTLPICAYIVS